LREKFKDFPAETDSPRFHSHFVGSVEAGAHLAFHFQYRVGAAIFLSASNAREKTRNHRHTVSFYEFLYEFLPVRNLIIKCRSWPLGVNLS
jgi:hypothetical protein